MIFSTLASLLVTSACAAIASALTIPGASTPGFYLVSSSTTASANLMPLRMAPGLNGYASLTGTGTPAIFYFYQGQLLVYDPNGTYGNTFPFRPFIDTQQTGSGCATFGPIGIFQGGSSNKCASYSGFQIQSNNQNSQLGAELVFNYVGGFYSCSGGQEVYYKQNANDGPSSCVPIHLNTVAVP